MGVIKKNERFRKMFSEYLINQSKPSTTTYGGYYSGNGGYFRNNGVHIYFYEWSSMRNCAKTFDDKEKFFAYCKENKITITDECKKTFESENWVWCTCIPGSPTLMAGSSYVNLETKLKKEREKYEERIKNGDTSLLPCPVQYFG